MYDRFLHSLPTDRLATQLRSMEQFSVLESGAALSRVRLFFFTHVQAQVHPRSLQNVRDPSS